MEMVGVKLSGGKMRYIGVDKGRGIYVYKADKENELEKREWIRGLYSIEKKLAGGRL